MGSPETCTQAMESNQTVHPTTATTKSLVNPNKPIQGDKDDDNEEDENGQVAEWGSLPLTLSASALADILEIPKLMAMDDLEIQEIGSNSKQAGSSQQATSKHDISTSKKDKSEKFSSRSYKSSQETHKEVYDTEHKFNIHIWNKMERDGSINLSTVATSSPIFEVLDHIVPEEEKSNYCDTSYFLFE